MISILEGNVKAKETPAETMTDLAKVVTATRHSLPIYSNGYRAEANFREASYVVLDFDGGMPLEEAQELFRPYKRVIALTRNHMVPKHEEIKPRFRVYLKLSSCVLDLSQYRAISKALLDEHKAADQVVKDGARMLYEAREVVEVSDEGEEIDVEWYAAMGAATAIVPEIVTETGSAAATRAAVKGRLATATTRFLTEEVEPGTWNQRLFKAAKDMYEQGYTENEAVEKLGRSISPSFSGALDESDLKTISSAFRKPGELALRSAGKETANTEEWKEIALTSKIIMHPGDDKKLFFVHPTDPFRPRHEATKSQLVTKLGKDLAEQIKREQFELREPVYRPDIKEVMSEEKGLSLVYNTYVPTKVEAALHWGIGHIEERVATIPPRIDKFLNHFVDNNTASKEYLLDWLANALQNRNFTTLVAIGGQGSGKGVFGENLCQAIFGRTNAVRVEDKIFKDRFNGEIEGKRFVFVDEVALDTKEAMDRFKAMVNSTINVEAKFKDNKTVDNYASFYIASNDFEAIKFEGDADRRLSILDITDTRLVEVMEAEEIDLIDKDEKEIEEFTLFLWQRKPKHNMLVPFRGQRTQEILEASMSQWQAELHYNIAPKFAGKEIKVRVFQDLLEERSKKGIRPGVNKMTQFFRKYKKFYKYKHDNKGTNNHSVEVLPAAAELAQDDSVTVSNIETVSAAAKEVKEFH